MRRPWVIAALVGGLVVGCSGNDAADEGGPPICLRPSSPSCRTDPLDQMVLAFDGSHTRTDIQAALDQALSATGHARNREIYNRAGNVLVDFRREYGVSEMDTLACVPNVVGDNNAAGLNFRDAAALCVAKLATRE